MSHFVPFIDNNSSSNGLLTVRQRAEHVRPRAKSMTTSGALVQRKALGDRNINQLSQATRNLQLHDVKKPQPTSQKNQSVAVSKSRLVSTLFPEIERMPIVEEGIDTFEDIWAASERPDTYTEEIKNWRSSRIFPDRHGESAFCEDSDMLRDISEEPRPAHNFSFELMSEASEPALEDLTEFCPSAAELSLPPLDLSFDSNELLDSLARLP